MLTAAPCSVTDTNSVANSGFAGTFRQINFSIDERLCSHIIITESFVKLRNTAKVNYTGTWNIHLQNNTAQGEVLIGRQNKTLGGRRWEFGV